MDQGQTAEPHESTAQPQSATSSFPIVGIGASAGGLAVTVDLLQRLGATPGLAVVVVHHLDPKHESSLVEILARSSELPVSAATDGMVVEPDHVYVVPPNAGLLISGGALRLTPRTETEGRHLPIDRFLESLAVDHTTRAVGVILSGTGSDGAQGIRAIKADGGVTFAQNATAEYRSMPSSAIATGCVDFVLPIDGIARELLRMGDRMAPLASAADDALELQRILLELRKASGIDFASYKQTTVRRRVQRRVVVHGLSTLHEYAELLARDPAEFNVLCEEILIHVTSFFRDAEVFDVLKATVFPTLLEKRPRDAAIRVWVPGCSTGEEVYSIAIALLEFLADAGASEIPVKLFGTDVSLGAIEKARAGRYPTSIEREVSAGRLQQYFLKLEDAYQIRPEVRDLCVFAKQDATNDPPFSGIDLISCRNLMIYLGSSLQDRILPILHYALKEPGFLVLGTSETTRSFPGFAVLDQKNKIYARTSAAPRVLFDFNRPQSTEPTQPHVAATTKTSGPMEVHREADRLVLAEFAPPGVVITDDLAIVQFRGKTGAYLEPTPGVASFDLLRMVRDELRIVLRQLIDDARTSGRTARRTESFVEAAPTLEPRKVEVEVIPFGVASTAQRFFVVLFREVAPVAAVEATVATAPNSFGETASGTEGQLRQELESTRHYLQSVIEQLEASNEELKAANEEIVSSNEELRSTNEELQMAKEELQSTNEELRTVNEEMTVRNAEGLRLSDDLTNVLSSVEIPIMILGRDMRLRRFTPAAARMLRLSAQDIGRPLVAMSPFMSVSELEQLIAGVLDHLGVVKRAIHDEQGRWFQLTVRPYLTADNRIDGTVVSLLDIDEIKKTEQLFMRAQQYAESIVNTVREALLVLDRDLRVRTANQAFCRTFAITPAELEGRFLYELRHGEWDIPNLRQRLTALGEGQTLEGFSVAKDFEKVGFRSLLLNARHIEATPSLLLAIEDVTDSKRAAEAIERSELSFRQMLATAAEAVLMTDAAGNIAFANRMAEQIFGYPTDSMLGISVDTLLPERLRAGHVHSRAGYLAAPSPRPMGRGRKLVGRRKDGSEFPIEVTLSVVDAEHGPVVVSFVTDMTRREESEQKIREYQDKLQRMAFDAALAEERERRRIAADLHDRIGQSLALAQIKLTAVRDKTVGEPRKAIDDAVNLLAQSASDTRSLTFELSPPVLYDLGLKDALAWLIEDIEKRQGLKIELTDDEKSTPLDEATAAIVFRSVRELLMNVFKHAKTPTARISLRQTDDSFEVEVEDAGAGFDPEDVASQSPSGGFGLFSVREQMARLGGSVDIKSAAHQGTRVSMRVPLKTGDRPPSE